MRPDVAAWLPGVFSGAQDGWSGQGVQRLPGGRGGVVVLDAGDARVIVRPCRRGGLPARVLRDVYFGWNPRPLRELRVSLALREAGAPVVEAFGAAVQWLAPGCYRGWLASRFLPDAVTLWQWVENGPPASERQTVLAATGTAIRQFHACGGRHPDLNLNNVLVQPRGVSPRIVLIDLDRATVHATAEALDAMLQRLARSARKLDPHGSKLDASDLQLIERAARNGAAGDG